MLTAASQRRGLLGFSLCLLIIVAPQFTDYFETLGTLLSAGLIWFRVIQISSNAALAEFVRFAINTLSILAVIHFVENKDARSIGILRIEADDFWMGIGMWLSYVLVSLLSMEYYKPQSVQYRSPAGIAAITPAPFHGFSEIWYFLVVAADVIFEELSTRAYIIERVIAATGSKLLGGVISFGLSELMHARILGAHEALLLMPGLLILTVEYLITRRLTPCVITHYFIDTYFWVIAINLPVLSKWFFLPQRVFVLILVELSMYSASKIFRARRRNPVFQNG